jgi:hypothetical protein
MLFRYQRAGGLIWKLERDREGGGARWDVLQRYTKNVQSL